MASLRQFNVEKFGGKITVGSTHHRRTTMGRFNNQSLSNTQGLLFTPACSAIMKKEIGTRAVCGDLKMFFRGRL
jgi:hypothetical protein